MTIDFRVSILLLIAVAACDAAPRDNAIVATPEINTNITGQYNPELFGNSVVLAIINNESFPVCFSSNDLELIEGSTFIRSLDGTILNGHGAGVLEDLRGINVASPVGVLRPGKERQESIDLDEFSPDRQALYVQIQLHLFRCSDLFDDAIQEVRQTLVEKTFRIAGGRMVEQPGLRFPEVESAGENIAR